MKDVLGRDTVVNEYFLWLVNQVDDSIASLRTNYLDVMEAMFEREYEWDYYMNANREADARHLRERYFDEKGGQNINYWPISVLEVLVALFVRYSDTVIAEPGAPSIAPDLMLDCLYWLGLCDKTSDICDVLDNICDETVPIFDVPDCEKWYDLWYVTGKWCIFRYEIE